MYLLDRNGWYLERIIFFMAGIFILVSTLLAVVHSIWWLIWTTLVGLNLVILSLTGFCPAAVMLARLGIKGRLGKSE